MKRLVTVLLRAACVASFVTALGCGTAPSDEVGLAVGASGAPATPMSGTTPTPEAANVGAAKPTCVPAAPSPLATSTSASAAPHDDTLDDALGAVDWSRGAFGVNAASGLRAPSALRPSFLVPSLTAPLGFFANARALIAGVDAAASATDAPVARTLVLATAVLAAKPGSELCVTLAPSDLVAVLRSRGLVVVGTEEAAAKLPAALTSALGPIVSAIADAKAEVDAVIPADAAKRASLENSIDWALWSAPRTPGDADVAIASAIDVARLGRAASALALTIERANVTALRGLATPNVTVPTSLGALVIRGPGNDVDDGASDSDAAALWIDTGGDDVVMSGAGAATKRRPISVHLDLAGNDRYGYVTTDAGTATRLPADAKKRLASGHTASRVPRQGAAMFGIGLFFDFGAGRDTYRSLALSQGAGAFGVGVLFDDGGDDDVAAETLAQGASVRGIGLLLDGAGNDKRTLFTRGQAYASWGGVGMLIDSAGDDAYRADPGEPTLGGDPMYLADLFTSGHPKVRGNHNAAQGFAEGRRDLAGTTTMASGGFALLRDRAGRDRYVAGAFAQGGALEEGAGILADGDGDDLYEGLAYVQGAGIHRGLGVLLDAAGDDAYDPTFPIVATSLGVGHDYGVGLLVDLAGADTFHGPTLSLGAGSAQGAGLLVDVAGRDTFVADTKATLGASANPQNGAGRSGDVTAGIFARAGGASSYRVAGKATSLAGSTWQSDHGGAVKSVGIDAPAGAISF